MFILLPSQTPVFVEITHTLEKPQHVIPFDACVDWRVIFKQRCKLFLRCGIPIVFVEYVMKEL